MVRGKRGERGETLLLMFTCMQEVLPFCTCLMYPRLLLLLLSVVIVEAGCIIC